MTCMTIRLPARLILSILCAALAVFAAASVTLYVGRRVTASMQMGGAAPVVVIDAGHGGFDGGTVAADGTEEKGLNLQIALRLRDSMTLLGVNTVMVREDDRSVETSGSTVRQRKVSDMHNRLALMKKYPSSSFISIHLNKFSESSSHGAQVFYAAADGSQSLAESIQSSIISAVQPENSRGIKPGTKDTFLLYHAPVPAVIVECGFLSNPADLANLKDENYQAKLAFAIACGYLTAQAAK